MAEDHHPALFRETFHKAAAVLSLFPFQRACLSPIAQRRLRSGKFMQHVDGEAAKISREGGCESQRFRIDVSPHRLHRRNAVELIEYRLCSYIAGM